MKNFEIPSAKENTQLFGHERAEKIMLEAFASGKLPNAWLISGPKGIGKATLAYRFARFLLTKSAPTPQSDGLFGDALAADMPDGLDVDMEDPVVGRIQAGSHGDFLVIDTENLAEDKVKKEIGIDQVRQIGKFLSFTPSEAERRVVIIDSADEMNRNAANAVLKILEEPPLNSIILLVSHNPGRLLPTIRSRCQFLKLNTLENHAVEKVIRSIIPKIEEEDLRFMVSVAEGSPGFALQLYGGGGSDLYSNIVDIFRSLPRQDIKAIDSLSDKVEGKRGAENWKTISYLTQYFLAGVVRAGVNDNSFENEIIPGENLLKTALAKQCSPAQWSELWEQIGHMSAEAEYTNLDKKHALAVMFSKIANEVA